MLQDTQITNKQAARTVWRIYFSLAILQTCVALALLFKTQSAQSTGLLFGISQTRLFFALGLMAVLLFFSWQLLKSWLFPQKFEIQLERLLGSLSRRRNWNAFFILCSIAFLAGLFSLVQLANVQEPFIKAFFSRLVSLMIWATGMSGLTVIALLVLRHGQEVFSLRPKGRSFYLFLLAIAAIFLGWSWVAKSVMPSEARRVGWNPQGVPIVEWQVLVAWLAGVLMLALTAYLDRPSSSLSKTRRSSFRWLDLLMVVLIWLGAVLVWQRIPLSPSWFLTETVAPNYEYYPRSDARAYDAMAQSALVGEGYRYYGLLYARRPLLAAYLTLLRLFGGQGYTNVVFLQVLILAWIPALIYLLTKALHTRMSAVMAALLIIFREANSIWLTERITTSHVKLIMADLPSMLLSVLFMYVSVIWLQNISQRRLLALVCGAALGFAMLVRPEMLVFLFPLLSVSAILLRRSRQGRLWRQSSLLIGLGLLLVISPWIWRNYRVTGELFFDNPLHNTSVILQRFEPSTQPPIVGPGAASPSPTATPAAMPASGSSNTNEALYQAIYRAISSILQNPGAIARPVFGHYLNSQVQTFLTLPAVLRAPEAVILWLGHRSGERLWNDCCGLVNYIREVPFWRRWKGGFPSNSLLALTVNLLLLAYGFHTAWKRDTWVSITPLLMAVTYLVVNAFFRNSGGRYILPVDWVMPVYFCVGLSQATVVGLAYLRGAPLKEPSLERINPGGSPVGSLLRSTKFYAVVLVILLLSCMVPAIEASFPQRYDQDRSQVMLDTLLGSDQLSAGQLQDLQAFLAGGGVTYTGRALYPRYLPLNVGDPGLSEKDTFSPRPYARIVFYLVGPQNWALELPADNEPTAFPNDEDVLVIGCDPRNILLVARFSAGGGLDEVYLRSPLPERPGCPLPVVPEAQN
jgi:hypothetical protein